MIQAFFHFGMVGTIVGTPYGPDSAPGVTGRGEGVYQLGFLGTTFMVWKLEKFEKSNFRLDVF